LTGTSGHDHEPHDFTGVLTVHLAKAEQTKPQHIEVKVA
jgi:hypothetical protein